jgi:hypothetical protein
VGGVEFSIWGRRGVFLFLLLGTWAGGERERERLYVAFILRW